MTQYKNRLLWVRKGKIKIIDGNHLNVVTEIEGEETIDRFTFDELKSFIEENSQKPSKRQDR